jgi:high-affinity iron transporter
MWHTGRILSEDSSFGDVLHSFFGYSDSPTPLQLIVYLAYLAIVIAAFLGFRAALRTHHNVSQPAIES